jgi:hypothetical protein
MALNPQHKAGVGAMLPESPFSNSAVASISAAPLVLRAGVCSPCLARLAVPRSRMPS